MSNGYAICARCARYLPVTAFAFHDEETGRREGSCKECRATIERDRTARERGERREAEAGRT